MLKGRADEVQVFDDLEDYVEQFTKIIGIKLENLKNLFWIFYCILLVILIAFLPSKRIFKRLRRSVRKLLFLRKRFRPNCKTKWINRKQLAVKMNRTFRYKSPPKKHPRTVVLGKLAKKKAIVLGSKPGQTKKTVYRSKVGNYWLLN